MNMLNKVSKMWNNMSLLQKVFVVVAMLTVLCSICADCFLCEQWPLRVPQQVMDLPNNVMDRLRPELSEEASEEASEEVSESFQNSGPKVVLFYVPWCPHCKNMMPEWKQLEQNLEGTQTKVDKVNCEEKPDVAKENEVDGFPTIILFKDGKSIPYEGDRTAEAIKDFVENN